MLLLTDPALRAAVAPTPGHATGSLLALASVAGVELTPNLAMARVFVSVYAAPDARAAAMSRLTGLQGYVRRRVAAAMRLRLVPEIRFVLDDTLEAGAAVEAALELAAARAAGLAEPAPITPSPRFARPAELREGYAWAGDDAPAAPRSAFPDLGPGAAAAAAAAAAEATAAEEDSDEDDGFIEWGAEAAPSTAAAPGADDDDSFFGFAPPPKDGFWAPDTTAVSDFGDGMLGADGFVRLAPGSDPPSPFAGGGGGGRRKRK